MNKAVLTLLLPGVLAGCSLLSPKPADIVIQEKPVRVICSATAQRAEPLVLKDTPPTLVLNTETEVWGYWFDPGLYAALAENLQAMRRYQKQLRGISNSIASCITDHNAGIPPAN